MRTAFVAAGFLAGVHAQQPDDVKEKYAEWAEKFGSSNGGDAAELDAFAENLKSIAILQDADPSATYSHMTPFANLSPEQFSMYKGFASPPADKAVVEVLTSSDLPADFDWRETGAVNPIKDQKQCGSCWAFSVVANVEGAGFVDTGKLASLSEQQLVDCSKSTGDLGCQGGLPENTFQAMITENRGLELESDYPYTARDGTCKESSSSEVAFITAWKKFSRDEDEIAAGLQEYGPLSIGINANTMQLYSGGVADPSALLCSPYALDHGVAIVGFGTDSSTPYWTIRNSWGLTWGELGYYRIVRGKGACGLNTDVTTATGVSVNSASVEVV